LPYRSERQAFDQTRVIYLRAEEHREYHLRGVDALYAEMKRQIG